MSDLLQFILNQQDQFRRARIPSLFSDFTVQKYTNPDGYNANVNIWNEVLRRAARAGLIAGHDGVPQRLSLETGPYLSQKLESSEWGKPLALNAVIDEAISQRQMLPYHDFLTSSRTIYSQQWTELPWRFVAWGLNQMGMCRTFSRTDMQASTDLVLIPNIEVFAWASSKLFGITKELQEVAGKVLNHLERFSGQVDRTFTTAMFNREVASALGIGTELADKDLRILIQFLFVKLYCPDEVYSPISKEDRAIAALRSLIEDISKQIRALQTQIAAAREKSQRAVESKNRPSALAALRSKKSAESVLSLRMDTLFQLEQIFTSIKKASDHIALVGVMENSAEVLRSLNAKVGSVHNVENALDCLKTEMGKVEDIATLVSEAGQETGVADENEIDKELDALLRQKERAEEEQASELTKQRLADLDHVGSTEPSGTEMPMLSKHERPTSPKGAPISSPSERVKVLKHVALDEGRATSSDNGRRNEDRSQSVNAMLEC
ncbi:MAG: hypothetical protein Q9200_001029 [Gallowayella weberi]